MQKQKKITIDGEQYEITQLPADVGAAFVPRLLKAVAPAIGAIGKWKELGGEGVAAEAIRDILLDLDEKLFADLIAEFRKRSTVRVGEKWPDLGGETFNQHFAGRYVHMVKWLVECFKHSFTDFLGVLELVPRKGAQAEASKSPSPTT